MASSSKLPRDSVVKRAEFSFSYPTAQRPLQLLAGFILATLTGLVCAGALTTLLQNAARPQSAAPEVVTVILAVLAICFLGTAAVAAISENRSHTRLLIPFNCSFLVHYIWFSVAPDLDKGIDFDLLPASFAAVLACSVAIEFLWATLRRERIGAVAYGLSPEYRSRLGRNVHLVTGPTNGTSPKYDILLVDFSVPLSPEWSRFVSKSALMGCEVRHVSSYAVQQTASLSADDVDPDSILRRRYGSIGYVPLKRSIDIAVVLLMAPVVIPIVTIAIIAIIASMGRPTIFVQERVGIGGRTFRMYKLRTMCAQDPSGMQCATVKGDMRVTPIGRILRRFRIDELPQLLNVIKGDMSLIGPRPEQPQLVARYRQHIPYYDLRHSVQPGLSGWAQVNFGYASTIEETRAKTSYDLFYVKEFSLALDIEIAIATVWVILRGSNVR